TAKSLGQIGPVIAAYDFTPFKTIGDIGGGAGHMLAGGLGTAPAAEGVLFALPEVVRRAAEQPHPRIRYVGGSFFDDPIPPCDAYMLMTVLHDWSDEESIVILKNLKANAPRTAKVLILEGVVRPDARNDFLLDLDIEMRAMTTGLECTEAEW